ncbi:Zn-ribbon domain-containing OB-fold protein [Bradyrhizobium sp. dw_78]|uniref:Zn-ribbon domain-containing OB-fold protein n=1 Tax=Bradyrhizobium sp. dw_78 TaxID=2719793 RepID=UPI001BD6B807|nr:Zn-ribbon domain-containing OB-fold protein [Bradyrhizobium sp. dw_78]
MILPPETLGPEAAYQAALDQGRFFIQQCADCRRAVFYPRTICPHCSGRILKWIEPSGRGTVYSVTTVRRKPEHGGDYNVSLIDLSEGVRMMSSVRGISPHEVQIGMSVRAEIVTNNGSGLVVFKPADQTS